MKTSIRRVIGYQTFIGLIFLLATGCGEKTVQTIPVVTTAGVTEITKTTALSGGEITSDGDAPVTARGLCWSTKVNPTTIADTYTNDGSGLGSFSSNMIRLTPATTYYIRAYATNSIGTAYGNEVSFTTSPLTIGDEYQGGKIAYILQQGDPGYVAGEMHGIIAAVADLSSGIQWHNGSDVATGATATAIGTGNANTIAIVDVQGAGNYAAKACYDLVEGGYSDWYLPSQDELHKLYLSRNLIGGLNSNYDEYYWSSSEYTHDMSFFETFFFQPSFQGFQGKHVLYRVRAVRSF